MDVFARVRAAVEKAMSMSTRAPTGEELQASRAAACRESAAAATNLEQAENRYAAATLNGAGVDELAQARAHRALEEARSRASRVQDRLRVIDVAIEDLQHREYEAREAAKWAKADEALRRREVAAGELDSATKVFAQKFVDMVEANVQAFEALPRRPSGMPALFSANSLHYVIELALFAHTDRAWLPRNPGFESAFTARKLPTVKQRASAERELLMTNHRPAESPGPEAA